MSDYPRMLLVKKVNELLSMNKKLCEIVRGGENE